LGIKIVHITNLTESGREKLLSIEFLRLGIVNVITTECENARQDIHEDLLRDISQGKDDKKDSGKGWKIGE
jgi:hypothetical protein